MEVLLGWATLELDRAADEIARTIGAGHNAVVRPGPDDELLGARTRLLECEPGVRIVLLEPKTEGRIAASLVRFGEGVVAEYVIVEDELERVASRVGKAGLGLSTEADGPFGRQRLVAPGRAWGAHLILAARRER